MRNKRFFWNMRHHKELDRLMGLSKRMPSPLAQLADACGMDATMEGTRAMMPVFIVSTRHGDIKQTKPYDITNEEARETLLMATIINRPN